MNHIRNCVSAGKNGAKTDMWSAASAIKSLYFRRKPTRADAGLHFANIPRGRLLQPIESEKPSWSAMHRLMSDDFIKRNEPDLI